MSDLISRQAAIDAVIKRDANCGIDSAEVLKDLPSAQPEEIGYEQCANAMMKMWIDEVVTDGEYNKIMDKLNKHWRGEQE